MKMRVTMRKASRVQLSPEVIGLPLSPLTLADLGTINVDKCCVDDGPSATVCRELPNCCPADILANGLFEAVDPLMGLPSITSCAAPSDLFRSWGKRDRSLELAGSKVKLNGKLTKQYPSMGSALCV